MNLHVSPALAPSCQTLDASSISSAFHLPDKPAMNCRVQLTSASSCLAGTAFPIPRKTLEEQDYVP
jgi:hypothetical protein